MPYAAANAVAKFLVTALLLANCCVVLNATLVNVAAAGVTDPIITLSSVPPATGEIINCPDPVGLIVTLAFAGVKLTTFVAVNDENVPALGVVVPIVILSKVPVVAGLIVNVLVTDKFCMLIVGLILKVSVFVELLVVTAIPLFPTTVSVLVVAFKPIVFCPDTAI